LKEKQPMPRIWEKPAADDTCVDDPELIEKVAIAIFERTQGSWEYAREADRQWLRLEARAAIATFLEHVEERAIHPRPARIAATPIPLR
jgi:hypothetical protein